jgi:hypothetical protein
MSYQAESSPYKIQDFNDRKQIIKCVNYALSPQNYYQSIKVDDETLAFTLLQELYVKSSRDVYIMATIHQNTPDEPLHFSISIPIHTNYSHNFHFNGFMKDGFCLTSITSCRKVSGKGYIIDKVATFNNNWINGSFPSRCYRKDYAPQFDKFDLNRYE